MPLFLQQADEVRRLALARRDLDDVGGAVARRDLHHAEPVAMRVEPQRLGVDGDRPDIVVAEVGQIVFVEADRHRSFPQPRRDAVEDARPRPLALVEGGEVVFLVGRMDAVVGQAEADQQRLHAEQPSGNRRRSGSSRRSASITAGFGHSSDSASLALLRKGDS